MLGTTEEEVETNKGRAFTQAPDHQEPLPRQNGIVAKLRLVFTTRNVDIFLKVVTNKFQSYISTFMWRNCNRCID